MIQPLARSIAVISIYGLLLSASTHMLYSHLALFLKFHLGVGESQIAFVDGLVEFLSYLIRIFSGIMSDYCGDRRMLLLMGCVISCLIKPIFALADSFSWVLSSEIVERFGMGVQACPKEALIADFSKKNRYGASFGFSKSMKTVGAVLGASISLVIMWISNGSYRLVFACASFPALLAVLVLTKIDAPNNAAADIPETLQKLEEPNQSFVNPFQKKYLKSLDGDFFRIIGLACVCELGHFSDSLVPIRACDFMPQFFAGSVVIFVGMGQAIFAYPCGILADKYGNASVLIMCLAFMASAYVSMAVASSIWGLYAGAFVAGGQQLALQAVFLSMINERVSCKLRATAIGLFYCSIGVSYLIAAQICGWLCTMGENGYFYAFSYCFCMCICGLLLAIKHRKKHNKPGKIRAPSS